MVKRPKSPTKTPDHFALTGIQESLSLISQLMLHRYEAEQQILNVTGLPPARQAQPSTQGEKYISGRWIRRSGDVYRPTYVAPAVSEYKARVRRQFPRHR